MSKESDFHKNSNNPLNAIRFMDDHKRKMKRENFLLLLLALSICIVFSLYFFVDMSKRYYQQTNTSNPISIQNVANTPLCDEVSPPDKSSYILDPSVMKRSDVIYSGLELVSKYRYHIVIEIISPNLQKKYQMVSIFPESKTTVSLPVGSYGLRIKAGNSWCNTEVGFSDGRIINVGNLIEIQSGSTQQLRIESLGSKIEDIHLALNKVELTPPSQVKPMQVDGYGVSELQLVNGSNYYIKGSIGGVPVNFQVDTGANLTSIPLDIAQNAGISSCTSQAFDTANGNVIGCVAIVPELTFGNFRIENIEVAVMPNLKGSLLGMNVLSHVRMEQSNGIMRLLLD